VDKSVVVIGSGAGGSVAAWTLAEAGFDVVILEKGRSFFRGLDDPAGLALPLFGGDEIRNARGFPGTDALAEPRTFRSPAHAAAGLGATFTGDVNLLPGTVGGGTTHWDAKTPRFWKLDLALRERLGPVEGADVVDWPFGYDALAPYYDRVEQVMGVAGSLEETPAFALAEAPRGPYPMPPGPAMYGARVFQEAAARLGYRVHPFPQAINSQPYDGRPPCHNCGYCAGYGCPVNARGGAAVSFLRRALIAGAKLVTRARVTRIATDARGRATHVEYLAGDRMEPARIEAGTVVLAASAVESARLALLSAGPAHPNGLGNEHDLVGRFLCFHAATFASGVMPQRLHAHRSRGPTHVMLEPCVPTTEWKGRSGLPYLRGGVVEVCGSATLIQEARVVDALPFARRAAHKDWMRSSPMRDRMLGVQMLGEDLPQRANRVDLDPAVKDVWGLPVARVTYGLHAHEKWASLYWGLRLRRVMKAAGAETALFYPAGLGLTDDPTANNTRHQSGTLRCGADPERSVTDAFGRFHTAPNVIACDSSVFPTSGAFNPTLTIMAVALRNATALARGEDAARTGPRTPPPSA
jgi:choline dehydrogenase-like flavoprotein